jgi:site-specific DNA recombinase
VPRKPRLPAAPRKTASLYVRLSRAASDENLSLEGMLDDVRALAAREGLRIVAEHVDDGISGAVRDRPAFTAWLDDARHGLADTLATYHTDRLTREGINAAALILDAVEGKNPETGRIVRAPVRLIDTQGVDSSGDEAAFRFRFVIAAEVARAERERMRDRSRARVRRARAAGRFPGGTVPFGFRAVDNSDGPGRVLEVEPDEAAALRRAAERMIAGDPRLSVVRRFSREGFKPRRSDSWTAASLRSALTSDAAREHIFSAAENRAITQALAPRGPNPRARGRKPSRLLSGVLHCESCKRRLVVTPQINRSVRYRCSSINDGYICEAPVTITAELLEVEIERRWLDGWGPVRETIVVRPVDESADDLAEVLDEIDVEAALVVKLRGAERLEALARLEALEARRDELEATPLPALSVLRETGRTYAEAWRDGDLDERRVMLLRTVGALHVRQGRGTRGRVDVDRRLTDAYKLDPDAIDEAHGV